MKTAQRNNGGPVTLPKTYPVRSNNALNLTAVGLGLLGWEPGQHCQIVVDRVRRAMVITLADKRKASK